MRRFACWEVAATAVRRVARRAVRPRIAKVMVEVGRLRVGGGVGEVFSLSSVRGSISRKHYRRTRGRSLTGLSPFARKYHHTYSTK